MKHGISGEELLRMQYGVTCMLKQTFRIVTINLIIGFILNSVVFAGDITQKAEIGGTGFMTGTLTVRGGGSIAGGHIMVYDAALNAPPSPQNYDRAPDASMEIGPDGKFRLELMPGNYCLVAIKRRSGVMTGHPDEGDIVFRSLDPDGKPKVYSVLKNKTLDLGLLEAVKLSASLNSDVFENRVITTALEGVVRDDEGRPVENAVVVAFLHFSPREGGKPMFVSDKTGKTGEYVLRVTAGTYYLVARTGAGGGPPTQGQLIGYLGGAQPDPVTIKAGEIKKNINIAVKPFIGQGTFPETNAP